MTAKETAMRNVFKMVAFALLGGLVINVLLITVPLHILGIAACVIMLGCLVKMVYELELSKAEHRETLNKLNNPKA